MTLTTRLSLFFLASLAAVLVAFSAALYLLADRHLTRQLDDQLQSATRALASAAEIEPAGVEWEPHTRPFALAPGAFGDQLHWEVTTEGGRAIDRSPQPATADLLADADRRFRASPRYPRHFEHAEREWRVTRVRLAPESPPAGPLRARKHAALVLTVAVPLDPVHDTLRTLAAALAALTLAVLAVALVASRAVCKRALAPVARMADAARAMGAADLTDRLPHATSADEVTDLARAFNGLLDRLGAAFGRERRFAGEASHQLRTPLAALIGQVEVALRRERAPDEYRRALASVLDQAGRLRRVVEALLFLARSEGDARLPGLEATDLAVWVPARLGAWAEHPRFGEMQFEPVSEEIPAAIHPDLFGELLDALLDNALKYSAAGTPVVVRVGRDPEGVWAEVEDRGCGVAADDVPQLFRPFFRSDAARKLGVPGVGLGLAVAARVAAALGGSIHVASEVDRGTRVRVRLPAARLTPAPALREEAARGFASEPAHGRRVSGV